MNFNKSFQLASKTMYSQVEPEEREADRILDMQYKPPREISEQRYHPKIDYRKRQVWDGIGDRWSMGQKLIPQVGHDPYDKKHLRSRSEDIGGLGGAFLPKNHYERKNVMKFQGKDSKMPPWVYGNNNSFDESENVAKLIPNQEITLDAADIEIGAGLQVSKYDIAGPGRIDFAEIDKNESLGKKVQREPKPWDTGRSFGRKKPGYTGFVKSIKSENLYGNTYSNTTQQVYTKNFSRGPEYPPGGLKYVTSYDREFNDMDLVNSRMRPKNYFISTSDPDV